MLRRVRSLWVAAAVVLGVLPFAGGASATPYPNPAAITIADCCDAQPASPYAATVAVSGLTGTVTQVTATLSGLTHGASSDLDVLLVGPLGQSVLLASDTGISAAAATVTFDDSAAALPNGVPIASGTYQPTNNAEDCPNAGDAFPAPAPGSPGSTLAVFNGTDPTGTWSLFVVDDCEVDSGSLSSWTLTVTTSGSPATPFVGSAITIGDCCLAEPASAYPSDITVSGFSGNVSGLAVTLSDLTHGYAADLNVLLVGPTGAKALLMSDRGRAASVVDLTFSDAAGTPIPASSNLASGIYTPTNGNEECATGTTSDPFPPPAPAGPYGSALSVFNGTNPNGTWSLYVSDDCGDHAGSIASGWRLDIAGPTAVLVSSFSARRGAKGITVRWRTATERSLLGFNIYRLKGKAWIKLNRTLIRAKGLSSATGVAYSYLDRSAKRRTAYSYRLQSVGLNGSRTWRGTSRVRAR